MAQFSRSRTLAGTGVVVALVGVAALLQHVRDVQFPDPPPTKESLYLTSGTAARRLSLGYSVLAADLYWIRAIQYYGDARLRVNREASEAAHNRSAAAKEDFDLLYPLLDITTTLDPRFNIAYRFGSIFLAEPPPGGAGRPDLAVALLEKGLRERPDKWEYMQDIGFVHYWWDQNYEAAAQWFDKASKVPGAPWFLQSLAATTLAQGGNRESSRQMWQTIHDSAENDWQRNDAARRLQQFDAADLVDAVQRVIDAAIPRTGKLANWQDWIRSGVVRGIPLDPAGIPLDIDNEGRVGVAAMSPLYPLPLEPQHAPHQ